MIHRFFTLVFLVTLLSCTRETAISVNNFLDCNDLGDDYENYNGEELGCKFHFSLTEYDGQEYIELNSHCVDLARAYVLNENCVDICKNDPYSPNSLCGQYLSGREIIEILLIEK